jgi:hypothetical protein
MEKFMVSLLLNKNLLMVKLEINIVDFGNMEKKMEKVLNNGQTVRNMMAYMKRIKKMDMEF